MAVTPPLKAHDTAFTATWPPKRIVRAWVSRTGCSTPDPLFLVANRNRQLRGRDLLHQLEQVPLALLLFLDAEVVHRLQRLVVLLAEAHRALGRVEEHAFHRGDQLLGVGA